MQDGSLIDSTIGEPFQGALISKMLFGAIEETNPGRRPRPLSRSIATRRYSELPVTVAEVGRGRHALHLQHSRNEPARGDQFRNN